MQQTPPISTDKFWKPRVFAEFFNLSERQVRSMLRRGLIPGALRLGSAWRIPSATVRDLIDAAKFKEIQDDYRSK